MQYSDILIVLEFENLRIKIQSLNTIESYVRIMYKYNNIEQNLKIHDSGKRTVCITAIALMLITSLFSISTINDSFSSTNEAKLVNSTNTQNPQSIPLDSKDDDFDNRNPENENNNENNVLREKNVTMDKNRSTTDQTLALEESSTFEEIKGPQDLYANAPECFGVKATIWMGGDDVQGTEGDDVIVGGDNDDIIDGLGGDDKICGGKGNDTINGGSGLDEISGEEGNDTLYGDSGFDYLDGGSGTDDYGNGGNGYDYCNEIETEISCENLPPEG
ncbi:MAG: calcium-binding protein [Candidatus Nitrosocosmicus sp.]|nr:hypothetical protein [Candidatus Nitrosocosmicus sp.]